MSALLAGLAAALAVPAVFELLRLVAPARALTLVTTALAPARAAGRGGRTAAGEQRRLALVAALAACVAGWLIAGALVAMVLVAVGPLLARAVVRVRHERWRTAVEADAPAAARALADAYAAGHALGGALDVAASDGALAARTRELLRESVAAREAGATLDVALAGLVARSGPGAWAGIVALLLLQRETGGDLVRLLRELAEDLEHGARVEAEARSASAQARLTARIVVALPALGAAIALLAAPSIASAVISRPGPRGLLITAVVLQCLALVAVRRLARVGER
ncbi:unannotated protein [freshwater metagenome]|uniref:Unannotated protein n=1 Tax=freshwater metagenome TaxID=449393 RepID=A0A6J7I7V0_9ZZZZ|nr:hypothetical protein [Actinomycetota bacterium]